MLSQQGYNCKLLTEKNHTKLGWGLWKGMREVEGNERGVREIFESSFLYLFSKSSEESKRRLWMAWSLSCLI